MNRVLRLTVEFCHIGVNLHQRCMLLSTTRVTRIHQVMYVNPDVNTMEERVS